MAKIDVVCDVVQGFNFKKDRTTAVGFITQMTLGGVQLATDLSVLDPLKPTARLSVVAVLSRATWYGGASDPIFLSAQVSADNRQRVASSLMNTNLPQLAVSFRFAVYAYDTLEKKYFKRMQSDSTELEGTTTLDGSNSLSIAENPETEVKSPVNFALLVDLAPQALAQTIHVADSPTNQAARRWGVG